MKTCDGCGDKRRSEEWSLSAELAKSNRRMFIVLMVVIFLWFTTIAGFVLYLNQYDYASESTTIDAVQDGSGTNIVGNGDVSYGATSTDQNG
ncbi:MAG: hypothetical protein IKP68_08070 [Clostridia bacterium]|nr:hypothetical protein [Clostridia bacterium]